MIVTQQVYMPYKLGHIGTGLRYVIAEIGHRWVFLRPSTFPNMRRQRIKRDEWDKIIADTSAMNARGTQPVTKVSR